jgi:integrase
MARKPLQFVHEFRDRHGKIRRYFRRPGYKRAALPGLPLSPEFMTAYQAAMAGETMPLPSIGASRTAPGTINAAIAAYYVDNNFTTLAVGTRKMRRAILERFRQQYGDRRITTLESKHVAALIGSKKPFAARNWLKTLRGLLVFAKSIGLRSDDPTAGIKCARAKSDGFHSWTEDEIAQFEAKHAVGSRPRLAMALLLYTAQRRSDVVRMGRQHLKNGVMRIRQQKTGTELDIPVHRELQRIIASSDTAGLTFLLTEKGAPFSAAGFGNIFREWCDQAVLPKHCASHGLRKAACRRLAEAGCSAPQIASISGHKSLSEIQRYIEAAEQAKLARAAIDKVTGIENEIVTSNGKPN